MFVDGIVKMVAEKYNDEQQNNDFFIQIAAVFQTLQRQSESIADSGRIAGHTGLHGIQNLFDRGFIKSYRRLQISSGTEQHQPDTIFAAFIDKLARHFFDGRQTADRAAV